MLCLGRRRSADTTVEVVALNGSHSVVVREAGRPRLAISFDTVGNRIERLYIVVNPAKLGSLDTPIAIS